MRVSKGLWVALIALTCGAPLWAQGTGTGGSTGASTGAGSTTTAGSKPTQGTATTGTTGATTAGAAGAGSTAAAKPTTGAAATPPAAGATGGATTGTTGGAATTGTGSTGTAPATTGTTGATAGTGTGTTAGTAAPAAPMDGGTYVVRLRDLEQRVDELKEQIRRSHTRLSLLSDTILSGGVGGARAELGFRNELSTAFRLTRVLVVLDGAVQYNKQDDTGTLAEQAEIPVFSGSIPPGDHTVQVLVQLRGHGYGVFSYLKGYRFEIKDTHTFTVTEGKTIGLDIIAFEKGGVTTPIEQRPAIRYVEKLRTGAADNATPARTNNNAPNAPSGSTNRSGASGSFSVGTGGK